MQETYGLLPAEARAARADPFAIKVIGISSDPYRLHALLFNASPELEASMHSKVVIGMAQVANHLS